MKAFECCCPLEEVHPKGVTVDGVEYSTCPGAKTLGRFNAFMTLADNDLINEFGEVEAVEVPDGYRRADHIFWNGYKPDLEEWLEERVGSLNPAGRYSVLIHQLDGGENG